MLTRRALLPLFGVLPFRGQSPADLPQPVRNRLLLGGDVMLSRHVCSQAAQRGDPAAPFRDRRVAAPAKHHGVERAGHDR